METRLLIVTSFGLSDIVIILLILIVAVLLLISHIGNKRNSEDLLNLITKGIKLDNNSEAIIELSIRFWRLNKVTTSYDLDEQKKIERQFDRIERYLKSTYGIEIYDYEGRAYNNQNVKVSSIIASEQVTRKTIYKTLSPEIRYKGKVIKKSYVEIYEPKEKEEEKIDVVVDLPISSKHDETEQLNEILLKDMKEEVDTNEKIETENNKNEVANKTLNLEEAEKKIKETQKYRELIKNETNKSKE